MSRWLIRLGALSTVCLGLLVACSSGDEPELGGESDDLATDRQLRGSDLPDRTLSLTFDDGPGLRTTELAEFLAHEGVPSTFFINGSKVPGRQHHVDAVVRNGHLLANHTQNHRNLTQLSHASIVDEVAGTG